MFIVRPTTLSGVSYASVTSITDDQAVLNLFYYVVLRPTWAYV